jgi:DNA-binding NarL/FixJ family response regulator
MPLRILVVDDHAVVRSGLKVLLEQQAGWEVIAEAQDGVEAVDKVSSMTPDVVVLDVSMPRMNGLAACRLIRESAHECEILIVTQHDSPQMMCEAFSSGARGYVVKADVARDLVAAVEAVSEHRNFVPRNREVARANQVSGSCTRQVSSGQDSLEVKDETPHSLG